MYGMNRVKHSDGRTGEILLKFHGTTQWLVAFDEPEPSSFGLMPRYHMDFIEEDDLTRID
jgi:hypothetical protein